MPKDKLHILHLSSASTWRGGERQISFLIDGLIERGHQCSLMLPYGAALRNRVPADCLCISYKKRGSISMSTSIFISKYVKDHQVDIIHVHDSHAHNYAWIALEMFGLRTPVVVSRRVDFKISKWSLRKYRHPGIKAILTVSDAIKEILQEQLGTKIHLQTVHSGIDLQAIEAAPKLNLRKAFNLPTGCILVGNVAALADHKDQMTIVEAAKLWKEQYPQIDVRWLIFGRDDGERGKLVSEIERFHLQSSVYLIGERDDILSCMKGLDIYIHSSKEEGLGTSVIDAMYIGLPIISTQAGGLKTLIQDNKTGKTFAIGDASGAVSALHYLLYHPQKAKALGDSAKDFAISFDKHHMVANTLDVYHSIL